MDENILFMRYRFCLLFIFVLRDQETELEILMMSLDQAGLVTLSVSKRRKNGAKNCAR